MSCANNSTFEAMSFWSDSDLHAVQMSIILVYVTLFGQALGQGDGGGGLMGRGGAYLEKGTYHAVRRYGGTSRHRVRWIPPRPPRPFLVRPRSHWPNHEGVLA